MKEEYLKKIDKIIENTPHKNILSLDNIVIIAHNICSEVYDERLDSDEVLYYIVDKMGYSEYFWEVKTNYRK